LERKKEEELEDEVVEEELEWRWSSLCIVKGRICCLVAWLNILILFERVGVA